MSDTIKVKITRQSNRRYWQAYYDDPVTGERHWRSTKATRQKDAQRFAARWEDELLQGIDHGSSRISWEAFRERFEGEHLADLSPHSRRCHGTALNHFQRVVRPQRLESVTSEAMSRFVARLRDQGMKPTTISTHLRHLKAAFRWAHQVGLLVKLPRIAMPRQPRGQKLMRGRPLKLEEFERMLSAVPAVRRRDAAQWQRYLRGLWLSGLRLEESLRLSWDADAPLSVELTGRYPRLRILAEAQKARRDELLPITPDFAEFLLETPPGERQGSVFRIVNGEGKTLTPSRVSRAIAAIGRRAGVITDAVDGRTATAHDLRRSFGTRWAAKVRPATLQRLMRHANIQTTMSYYVAQDADDLAAELWGDAGPDPQDVRAFVHTPAEMPWEAE